MAACGEITIAGKAVHPLPEYSPWHLLPNGTTTGIAKTQLAAMAVLRNQWRIDINRHGQCLNRAPLMA